MKSVKRGKPEAGIQRLITHTEHHLLRKLGIKRTHYIGSTPENQTVVLCKKKNNGIIEYKVSIRSTPEAIEILHKFWGIA